MYKRQIQTVDLTKKFNDFVANDHINLDVKEQEIKCIVGENGAGKSTMMNMLYGLLQPTSGKILIRGKMCIRDRVTLLQPVHQLLQFLMKKKNRIMKGIKR